jgi:hypothetical protein
MPRLYNAGSTTCKGNTIAGLHCILLLSLPSTKYLLRHRSGSAGLPPASLQSSCFPPCAGIQTWSSQITSVPRHQSETVHQQTSSHVLPIEKCKMIKYTVHLSPLLPNHLFMYLFIFILLYICRINWDRLLFS